MARLSEVETSIFTERRVILFGSVIAALNLVTLFWLFQSGKWVVAPDGRPLPVDFAFIWVSGSFAAGPHPATAYDYTAFAAAQTAYFGPPPEGGLPYSHFLYPPTFLLLTAPFGQLGYLPAFACWVFATFIFYEIAVFAIVPRAAALIAAASMLAALKNIQLGQNGFVTAGLIGLSLAFIERRPTLAGCLLGLLTYKPQFGVLFPLALIAGRQWRVLLSASVTAVILAALSAALFGIETWMAFFDTLRGFDTRLSPDLRMAFQYQSVLGWLQADGVRPAIAWSLHLLTAGAAAAIVIAIWLRPLPLALKAAALCIGALTVTPYVLTYDLPVLAVGAAFFVRDGLERGFRPGERSALLAIFLGSLMLQWRIAPLLYAALLALIVWRAWRPSDAAAAVADGAGS